MGKSIFIIVIFEQKPFIDSYDFNILIIFYAGRIVFSFLLFILGIENFSYLVIT